MIRENVIDLVLGDDLVIDIEVVNSTDPCKPGTPVNITGATLQFTAKLASDLPNDDTTAILQTDVTSHTDATNGKSLIMISNDFTTGLTLWWYKYDVQLVSSTGIVTTILVGDLQVLPQVTART